MVALRENIKTKFEQGCVAHPPPGRIELAILTIFGWIGNDRRWDLMHLALGWGHFWICLLRLSCLAAPSVFVSHADSLPQFRSYGYPVWDSGERRVTSKSRRATQEPVHITTTLRTRAGRETTDIMRGERGGGLVKRVWRMARRVYPRCSTISQAIAFNVFLAFFPILLLAVKIASIWVGSKAATLEAIRNFTVFLPPGSQAVVADFLERGGAGVWKYALVGAAGALIGGSQVMKLLMEGIHLIYEDEERMGFVHRQLRGLLLLLITMAPIVAAGILGVFGKPLRHWLTGQLWKNAPVHGMWLVFFPLVAMVLALLALTVIYWVARPQEKRLRHVLPGAAVATLLWWLVNAMFGIYVRRVPANVVFGGLAAVIGLLVWMQISAVIVFLGAAWNAEEAVSRGR